MTEQASIPTERIQSVLVRIKDNPLKKDSDVKSFISDVKALDEREVVGDTPIGVYLGFLGQKPAVVQSLRAFMLNIANRPIEAQDQLSLKDLRDGLRVARVLGMDKAKENLEFLRIVEEAEKEMMPSGAVPQSQEDAANATAVEARVTGETQSVPSVAEPAEEIQAESLTLSKLPEQTLDEVADQQVVITEEESQIPTEIREILDQLKTAWVPQREDESNADYLKRVRQGNITLGDLKKILDERSGNIARLEEENAKFYNSSSYLLYGVLNFGRLSDPSSVGEEMAVKNIKNLQKMFSLNEPDKPELSEAFMDWVQLRQESYALLRARTLQEKFNNLLAEVISRAVEKDITGMINEESRLETAIGILEVQFRDAVLEDSFKNVDEIRNNVLEQLWKTNSLRRIENERFKLTGEFLAELAEKAGLKIIRGNALRSATLEEIAPPATAPSETGLEATADELPDPFSGLDYQQLIDSLKLETPSEASTSAEPITPPLRESRSPVFTEKEIRDLDPVADKDIIVQLREELAKDGYKQAVSYRTQPKKLIDYLRENPKIKVQGREATIEKISDPVLTNNGMELTGKIAAFGSAVEFKLRMISDSTGRLRVIYDPDDIKIGKLLSFKAGEIKGAISHLDERVTDLINNNIDPSWKVAGYHIDNGKIAIDFRKW